MPTLLDESGFITTDRAITLKPYQPRPFIFRQSMNEDDIRNNVGSILMLDVECYPNYFTCGFKHIQSNRYFKLDRSFDPHFLSWILFNYQTVGFNSLSYDLAMLWAAYVNRDPGYLKSVSNSLIQSGLRIKEIAKEFGFTVHKLPDRQHVDLFNVCPLKGSLKLYGARLHSPRIQDLPIPDDKELTDEEIEIVQNYNYNDLDVTELVFNFCKERLELRAALSLEYNEDLMSKSDAQIAEAIIPKEVGKLNRKWVQRPEILPGTTYKYSVPSFLMYATKPLQDLLVAVKKADFVVQGNGKIQLPSALEGEVKIGNGVYRLGIGGLHSSEKNVGYKAGKGKRLLDTDMVSYYPAIIMNLGLYPVALGPNFLPIYRGFRDQRVTAKAAKNFTKDKGLKIFLNGMSGKLSDSYSKMYSPDLTIQVTVTGQLTLLMLIEMLECNGIEVISANTDGIVVYIDNNDIDKMKYWVKYFEDLTNFKTEETEYSCYYARDVNAYFAVKLDGSVKVKGPYSEVGSQSGTQLDNNPIMLICSDAIKLFLSKGIAIEKTIKECTNIERFVVVRNVKGGGAFRQEYLGKVCRWYYSKNSTDCIQYIASGNKVADSDNCQSIMDMPTQIPDDLDHQFYIDKCQEMLYDVGYYRRERQIAFF